MLVTFLLLGGCRGQEEEHVIEAPLGIFHGCWGCGTSMWYQIDDPIDAPPTISSPTRKASFTNINAAGRSLTFDEIVSEGSDRHISMQVSMTDPHCVMLTCTESGTNKPITILLGRERRVRNEPMIKKVSEQEVEVKEELKGGTGAVTLRYAFKKEEIAANCRLCAHLTVPPGAGIGPHQHDAEDELFLITSGSGILDDGESQERVNAGDAILTGDGESHALRNDGDVDMEIIAIIMCYGEK